MARPEWQEYADDARRLAVPGGWLFRTCAWTELPSGSGEPNRGYWQWSGPVFVPDDTHRQHADHLRRELEIANAERQKLQDAIERRDDADARAEREGAH